MKTEKKSYVKIEFTECSMDYDYTICPFEMVADQISMAGSDFVDIDEIGHKKCKPEIKLSVVFLTDEEWGKEFKSWNK